MRIVFANATLLEEANDRSKLIARYGGMKAKKICQRLEEITAASNLADLTKLPATGCVCIDQERQIVTTYTIPPHVILFSIRANFEDGADYLWEKVLFVEILSLDGA